MPTSPLTATESLSVVRRRLGLAQEELARLLGVSVLAVDRMERGYLAPPRSLAEALQQFSHRLERLG